MSVGAEDIEFVPVTFESCSHVEGPFYHGTKYAFEVGDQLVPGHGSVPGRPHLQQHLLLRDHRDGCLGRRRSERGHIYMVEPTGPFEDDPNVTNKKFPGNITQSYRTRHAMQIVGEVQTWEGHTPEVLNGMLGGIARLREQGPDVIED